MEAANARIGVAIVTRDRADELLATLERLLALPERPPIVVVDNGSSDGTVRRVRAAFPQVAFPQIQFPQVPFPQVQIVPLARNLGGAGRTVGVRRLPTPYVAFSDDDSWWAPGALERAADLLDRHGRLGLVAAAVLVGPQERL
ncbi:MAG: glycosyltransferase family 2 protein, partial [Gemmatimonadales bacterium]